MAFHLNTFVDVPTMARAMALGTEVARARLGMFKNQIPQVRRSPAL